MTIGRFLKSALRSLSITAATFALALGLLVVFHPFETLAPSGDATALARIEAQIQLAREDLRQAQTALQNAEPTPQTSQPSQPSDPAGETQQTALARDRADLVRRYAKTIRAALAADTDLSALPGIRDSVVVGQLLAQRVALDSQIADAGARLGPSHPTMRALKAQRAALVGQIAAQAGAIATALEAEAAADDAEIARYAALAPATPVPTVTGDSPDLGQEVAARQAELDRLMTTYFQQKVAPATSHLDPLRGLTNPLNLLVALLAALAAIVLQIAIALERRHARRRLNADLDAWVADRDAFGDRPTAEPLPQTELRRAS